MIGIILSTLCAVVLLVGLVSMAVVSSYFVIKVYRNMEAHRVY